MSLDGTYFCVGIPNRGLHVGKQTGSAFVYLINTIDVNMGPFLASKEIYGELGEDFGSSVALDGKGSMFIVGSPSSGIIRIYI